MKHFAWSIYKAFAVVIGPSMLAVPTLAAGQTFDDPAVAICEFVTLKGQNHDPAYKRLSGEINGTTAVIIYEMSLLNMAPATNIAECRYVLTKDGRYEIDFSTTKDEKSCATATEFEMLFLEELCEGPLLAVKQRSSYFASYLEPFISAGFYPISKSQTALNAE